MTNCKKCVEYQEAIWDRNDRILDLEAKLSNTSPPSPPVSGERFLNALDAAISDRTKDRDTEIGTTKCVLNGVLIGLKEARDLFAENAKNSPLTNEPVGVTISREDAELLEREIDYISTAGQQANNPLWKGLGDRLSAAIGERG